MRQTKQNKGECQDQDLVELLIEKLKDPNLSEDYTVDDFYDEVGVSKAVRTDFATAAMLKQMFERRKK